MFFFFFFSRGVFTQVSMSVKNFWLSFPLRPLVKWNNRLPKAEALPLHLINIVKWTKNNPECLDANLRENHKLLYCELITKHVLSETMSIPAITWIRSQPKELDNRLKDFYWLVLHRRLPVHETLYDHKLTNSKTCPRHKTLQKQSPMYYGDVPLHSPYGKH